MRKALVVRGIGVREVKDFIYDRKASRVFVDRQANFKVAQEGTQSAQCGRNNAAYAVGLLC